MNNTVTIKIEAPELASAIAQLADAITANHITQPQNAPQTAVNHISSPVAAMAAPVTAPAPPPVPVTTQTAPLPDPDPQTTAPAMPVAGAPTYTLDQISKAGAALVDAGKMAPLLGLLTKYGVQAITQLQPAQYGVFATELRALGAQI